VRARAAAAGLALLLGCAGSETGTGTAAGATADGTGTAAGATADGTGTAAGATAAATAAPAVANAEPELGPPPWTAVARGKEASFGLDVVDAESDTIRVTLTKKPESAVYRPLTLTVIWRPGPADGARGDFEVTIAETPRAGGAPRTIVRAFSVDVVDGVAPVPESPPPAPAGALVDFRGAEVLAAAAAAAPLPRVLERAPVLLARLPAEIAAIHRNPALDPASPAYEPAWALARWQLVAVRVRPEEAAPGVHLVYRTAAAEDAFLRVRFAAPSSMVRDGRPAPGGRLGAAAVAALVQDLLPDPRGTGAAVAPGVRGAALAALVERVLDPASGFELAAVDHSGRAGGGSLRDAADAYVSGDGWAFATFAPEGAMVPPRVVTSVFKRAGGGYAPFCAPRYDERSPFYVAGVGPLCTGDGLVSIEREKVGSALLFETSAAGASFRTLFAVRETAADDVRRNGFGETGMTCIACHTRDYDLGASYAAGPGHAARVGRTFFTIAGTSRPVPYRDAADRYALCALAAALEKLGKAPAFGCTLH